jgi:signal transduction histidine kinase
LAKQAIQGNTRPGEWQLDLVEALRREIAELVAANARLAQELEERKRAEQDQRDLAETLREVTVALNSTLELDEVLDRILEHLDRLAPFDAATVMLHEGGIARIVRAKGRLARESRTFLLALHFPVAELADLNEMASSGRPVIIDDVRVAPGWVSYDGMEWIRGHLGVPLCLGDDVVAFLNLESKTPGFYNAGHAERLMSFAGQAAAAIRNAQLHSQAQELAAMKERQHLARELHDAVSQTLWSATLIAEVLPGVWEQDPALGRLRLKRLGQLTQAALAEMRTLLMELRPADLTEVRLDELIQQLTAAAAGRIKGGVRLVMEGDCLLPAHVQVSLYRIAQGALNNVVRHAMARQVTVSLICRPGAVELTITDDGRGFDVGNTAPGHLGLGIMRERADGAGAELEIQSEPGAGTRIRAVWSPESDSQPPSTPS